MTDYKRLNLILMIVIVLTFSSLVIFYIYKYINIEPPTFDGLVSTRILGANERDVFLEMVWRVQNPSGLHYTITHTNMHFYEFGEPIARIFFEENLSINPTKSTNVRVYATIEKGVFESLMYNFIDVYSFNMSGTARARVLFFTKELQMHQFIPISIKEMVTNFLQLSFRNAIAVERVGFNNTDVEFHLRLLNRTGFDLVITEFNGDLEVNRNIVGFNPVLEPVIFADNSTRGTTRLRFTTSQRFAGNDQPFRYVLSGLMKLNLWETEYLVAVEISGENMNSDIGIRN